jgi:uncharacterized protein (TIGR02453 family)
MPRKPHFGPGVFKFLSELARNNRRDWFLANKERYEEQVKQPALRFIMDFAPELRKLSPYFVADPRPVGGSLFRIYRDTRFSKDKSPYKTHTGIHFKHAAGKDAHAPGFYLHLEPRTVFAGVGVWHPDGATLAKIRDAIVSDPARWKRARDGRRFRQQYELSGDSLRRPPRGYDPDHRYVEDLMRKDFVALAELTEGDVTAPGFLKHFVDLCKAGAPFVKYLCGAIGVKF